MTMVLTPVDDTSTGLRSLAETAADDLLHGLSRRELWGRLGWLDVKRRYRRTTIGPFWTSITLAVYVVTVGTVGAAIWHQNIYDYLPFLVSGMKQGWAFAWRSLMAAELYVTVLTGFGLGHLLHYGRELNAMDQVVGVMLVVVAIGLVADKLLFAPWERLLRRRWGIGHS